MAVTTRQQLESEGIEPFLKLFTSGDHGECAGADVEALRDHLERFLLNEVGSDLRAVKNAGDLLANMLEENRKLEKQVNFELFWNPSAFELNELDRPERC